MYRHVRVKFCCHIRSGALRGRFKEDRFSYVNLDKVKRSKVIILKTEVIFLVHRCRIVVAVSNSSVAKCIKNDQITTICSLKIFTDES